LQIAPSGYRRHAAQQRNPALQCARAKQDAVLMPKISRVINGLYKAELIHRRALWKTKAAAELATLEWVAWFNHHRLLAPIGYIPPAEAEENYYRQRAEQAATKI
jgi:transposase InsO family protein